MLGVSPNTLRSWERRYDFPRPLRSPGGHRQYALTEIESLRLALAETHNVSSAVSLAQERGEGPSSSTRLASAFSEFDEDKAARLLEESLALRSVERTIEEILLEALQSHVRDERPTVEYEFGWRFATGWLSAMKRVAPPASRPEAILILDASAPLDLDALHAQALELIVRRGGMRTLSLSPATDPARLGRALRALYPNAVVLTGTTGHARRDRPARLRGPWRRPRGCRLRLPRGRPGHRREHGLPAGPEPNRGPRPPGGKAPAARRGPCRPPDGRASRARQIGSRWQRSGGA